MRKKNVPSNAKEWFDYALFYCSNRETSRPRLYDYLKRKLKSFTKDFNLGEEYAQQSVTDIEKALDECERLKVIDHERFAGMLVREYARRGKGKRYVDQKLKEKGLKDEIQKIEIDPEEEFQRAVQLAEKSLERSNIRKLDDAYAIKTKVLQRLMSNGFDLSISKKAIEQALKNSPRSGK